MISNQTSFLPEKVMCNTRIWCCILLLFVALIGNVHTAHSSGPSRKQRQYIQVPETTGLHYYPYRRTRHDQQAYISSSRAELGKNSVLLEIRQGTNESHYVLLQRALRQHPDLFVYDVVSFKNAKLSIDRDISRAVARPLSSLELRKTGRKKRSPDLSDIIKDAHEKIKNAHQRIKEKLGRTGASNGTSGSKKVIHLPALFIEKDTDGFEHIFYQDLIVAALCLTNQPELDRHEIRDEYEALACTHKGYASILPDDRVNSVEIDPTASPTGRRKRQERDEYHFHDADSAKWHMDKNKYDILWKDGSSTSSSSTVRSLEPEIVEDLNYDDYEFSEEVPDSTNTTGWEEDEVVDPEDLDFIVWPHFLPITGEEKVNKSDQLRSKLHNHPDQNYTLNVLRDLLRENHSMVEFDRRMFALNESSFLSAYYTYTFNLSSYNYEPLIEKFFKNREATLSSLSPSSSSQMTLDTIRQLFVLYTIDVHHVNSFNRHIRFYGYVMKKPSSINGDEITNDGRLTRGITMRALELLRHVPQYNRYKGLFLRMLIAALKERASVVKHSTKLIEENDYTELFEVASYLEHLLQHGIHPDEKDQDLFVQETRFYAHHFMNTLTL